MEHEKIQREMHNLKTKTRALLAKMDGNTEADSRIAAVGNSENLRQPRWSSSKTQRK